MVKADIRSLDGIQPLMLAVAISLMGLLLRLFQLGEWSFWYDEALTVLLAAKPAPELIAITAGDVHPPLYYLLVKLFMLAGKTEFVIRLPSALFGAGSVLMLYFVGRDLFGPEVGLLGAFLLAISPLQLFYAQEARMYTQLLFLTIFSSWCFIRALRDDHWRWWSLFVGGLVLASYTAYFIFPVIGAMGLYVLLVDRRGGRLKHFLFSLGVVIVLYLPWISIFMSQTRSVIDTYWMAAPSPLALFTTLAAFFVGYTLPEIWVVVSLAATLLIVFIALNNVRHVLADRVDRIKVQPLLWLLLWAFVPLLGIFLISLVRPIFQLRTVITAAPAFYLLVAWDVIHARQKKLDFWLFLPTLALMVWSMFNFYFNPAFVKPSWREAAQYVQQRIEVGDVVLHTSPGSFLPFLAYDHSVEHFLLPDPAVARQNAPSQPIVVAVSGPYRPVNEAVRGHERIWLVTALDQSIEYQQEQKEQFDKQYELLDETAVNGIHIFTYASD